METEKQKHWREVHEAEVAKLIARHLEKQRIKKQIWWDNFNKKKEQNNGG